MPIHEFRCSACGAHREALLKIDEMAEIRRLAAEGVHLVCPVCNDGKGAYREAMPSRAPLGRIGGEGSERDIAAMQKSFKERFFKSGEADAVRHKHGVEFDDSIRGAAVERIKNAGGKA